MWSKHRVKILSVLLFLSLAGNAGLASWVAGKKTGEMSGFLRQRVEGFMDAARTFPPEQRKAVFQVISLHGPALKQAIKSVREQQQEIHTIAGQDQVDLPALDAAFSELRHRTMRVQEEGHAMVLDIIPRISPEQRRAIFEKQKKFSH